MEECKQFDTEHLYNICTGKADMPKWKMDAYRVKFGLKPLFNQVKEEVELTYETIGCGPGSVLMQKYKDSGVPPCQACFKLAKKMNLWGPDRCLKNIGEIVEDILPRAKAWVKNNAPWTHFLLPGIVEDAGLRLKISSDVKVAIEASRTPQNVISNKVNSSSRASGSPCACGQ